VVKGRRVVVVVVVVVLVVLVVVDAVVGIELVANIVVNDGDVVVVSSSSA
jgi:hypothetical protein